jgi:hypothetical protein
MINKVAFLISWPREIDFYQKLITKMNNHYELIIDDFSYTAKERKGNTHNIKSLLKKEQINYTTLTNVLNKKKYRVIVSTGLSYKEKINLKSLLIFIYARTIGSFFELSKLSNIIEKLFKKRFSAGGKNREIFYEMPVERKLGEVSFHFPRGLDISMNSHPHPRWNDQYDYFLTHGKIDKKLIEKKFNKSKCISIGYPRYDFNIEKNDSLKFLKNDLKITNQNLPIIFWAPTFIKFSSESILNIEPWIESVSKLSNKYNILLRPHPKTIITENSFINDLIMNYDFIIDINTNRRMYDLYNACDLVLADYGGSVFSSIYLKKKMLLLNIPSNSFFLQYLVNQKKLELEVRNDFQSIDLQNSDKLEQLIHDIIHKNNESELNDSKQKYFGTNKIDDSNKSVSEIILDTLIK